jgi:phage/plasmid-like protein (TIGR03299 family)
MPAYFESGFSVREPMWHGRGLVLDDYPGSWDEARVLAGLDWEPEVAPVYVATDTPADGRYEQLAEFKAIRRSDTGAVLAVSSDSYEVIRHAQMGELVEAILEQPNVRWETAGSVRGGRQVWALAYLDEPFTVPGDPSPTYPFLTILNSHDGSAACKVVNTSIRVVCWNTFHAASLDGDRTGRQFTFRHTRNVADRIADAKAAVAGLRSESRHWFDLARELSLVPVAEQQFNHFLAEFIPAPAGDVVSERVRDNIDRARAIFRSLYLDSPTTEGVRGSAYGLVQAAGEYLDHARSYRTQDSYLGRTLLRPEPLKAKAVALARRVTR